MFNRIGRRITNAGNDVAFAVYNRAHGDADDRMEAPRRAGGPAAAPRPAERPRDPGAPLGEEAVYGAFHEHARRAVFDAVRAGLLTKEQVEDLDPDIMFVVPALTLIRAALANRDPRAVAVPQAGDNVKLTLANCPSELRPMLVRWQALAPRIKAQENQIKKLRLYLAGRGEDNTPAAIKELASDINGLAIEITQRRTYQARFTADVNSVVSELEQLQHQEPSPSAVVPSAPPMPLPAPSAPPMPAHLDALEDAVLPESPELDMIRETLYGAIADDLDVYPALGEMLQRDRARALFGATALAMARVAETVATPEAINTVLSPRPLTLASCPEALQPLFNLLTSRHALVQSLTRAERADLRAQLLGTRAASAATSTRVLALASQLSIATARVMSLPRHLANIERAFTILGY